MMQLVHDGNAQYDGDVVKKGTYPVYITRAAWFARVLYFLLAD